MLVVNLKVFKHLGVLVYSSTGGLLLLLGGTLNLPLYAISHIQYIGIYRYIL